MTHFAAKNVEMLDIHKKSQDIFAQKSANTLDIRHHVIVFVSLFFLYFPFWTDIVFHLRTHLQDEKNIPKEFEKKILSRFTTYFSI